MKTDRELPNSKRAGSSHRKLSTKMKRKLRREKKKARLAGYSMTHFRERSINREIDKEMEDHNFSCRALYLEWKSRQPARPPKRKPLIVYVPQPEPEVCAWTLLARSFAESPAPLV